MRRRFLEGHGGVSEAYQRVVVASLKWCPISETTGYSGRLELPRECYVENGWMII